MTPITTTEALEALCDRLSQADFVTLDTEFLRDNTYYPKLCLIQVADDHGADAIDPLAEGIDLTAFYDLMQNTKVLKVLHACRQDLEIFYNHTGKLPTPIFDTQIAAMVCGFGDSVGYETLVTKIVKASLDKSARYTDWSRRPLTDKQIHYAIGDVTHLRDIYRYFAKQLEKTKRYDWVSEEMDILNSPSTYYVDPENAWLRMKIRTNKPKFLGMLKELGRWREIEAQERDMPRNRVAKDETLFEVAAHPPSSPEQLDKIRGLPKGFSRSRAGKSMLKAVEVAFQIPDDELPRLDKAKPRPATPPMADLLKVLLKIKSQEAGVAARMVASSQELESWAATRKDDEFRGLKGWRKEIFGNDAVKLMSGELALTALKGDIEIVELEDE